MSYWGRCWPAKLFWRHHPIQVEFTLQVMLRCWCWYFGLGLEMPSVVNLVGYGRKISQSPLIKPNREETKVNEKLAFLWSSHIHVQRASEIGVALFGRNVTPLPWSYQETGRSFGLLPGMKKKIPHFRVYNLSDVESGNILYFTSPREGRYGLPLHSFMAPEYVMVYTINGPISEILGTYLWADSLLIWSMPVRSSMMNILRFSRQLVVGTHAGSSIALDG